MVNKLKEKYDNPFDIIIYKIIDTQLYTLYIYNVTPNMLTTLSLISWIISAYYFYNDNFTLAVLFYFLSYYFDCADGKMARKYNMVTQFGDYYDHINDALKTIIFIIIMFIKSKKKFIKVIVVLIIFVFLLFVFINCQEKIYNKNNESLWLNKFNINIFNKQSCIKNMNVLRYFGPGTIIFIQLIIIALWKYI